MKTLNRIFVLSVMFLSVTFALAQPIPYQGLVKTIKVSGDQQVMGVTYHGSYIIDFFDVTTGDFIRSIDMYPNGFGEIALSPNGDQLIWTGSSGEIGLYNLTTNTSEILVQPGVSVTYRGLFWHPTNNSLTARISGGSADFYDIDQQKSVGGISDAEIGKISDLAFSPDGTQVITSHFNKVDPENIETGLMLWNMTNYNSVRNVADVVLPDIGGGVVDWSPDGTRIAALGISGFAIYNVVTNTIEVSNLGSGVEGPLRTVSWSPDGNYIATAGDVLRIWDVYAHTLVDSFGNNSILSDIVWSPDLQSLYYNGLADVGLLITTLNLFHPDITVTPTENSR